MIVLFDVRHSKQPSLLFVLVSIPASTNAPKILQGIPSKRAPHRGHIDSGSCQGSNPRGFPIIPSLHLFMVLSDAGSNECYTSLIPVHARASPVKQLGLETCRARPAPEQLLSRVEISGGPHGSIGASEILV